VVVTVGRAEMAVRTKLERT